MHSENYLAWVKEISENLKEKILPMTGNQVKFAEYMFTNYKEFGVIGNIEDVFLSVKNFIKYSENFKTLVKKKEMEEVIKNFLTDLKPCNRLCEFRCH